MTGTKVPIEGKVARILNSRDLALNIGSEDGVEKDMFFHIVEEEGRDIEDPETGEFLESVHLIKVTVMVFIVKSRISIATTFRKKRVNVGGKGFAVAGSALHQLLMPEKWISKYETLKSKDREIEKIDPQESYIEVGDYATQVVDQDKISNFRREIEEIDREYS